MRWLTRRTAPGAIAVLLFGGLAIKALADNPRAARVKEELSREVRGIPPPSEAALGGCEETSGWGKGGCMLVHRNRGDSVAPASLR